MILCLIFGIVVGLLANRKNRNPWLWGGLGAISWIIALLVLAFLPYRCKTRTHDVTNAEAKEKSCPQCDGNKQDWSSKAPPRALAG